MSTFRKEKGYERYAWIILFVLGILIFPLGSSDILRPVDSTSTPEAIFHIRLYGIAVTGLNILGLATILNSFRRGERWAWYVLWYYPIFFLSLSILVLTVQSPLIANGQPIMAASIAILFAVVAVVGLLLPIRKFFPKKQPVPP